MVAVTVLRHEPRSELLFSSYCTQQDRASVFSPTVSYIFHKGWGKGLIKEEYYQIINLSLSFTQKKKKKREREIEKREMDRFYCELVSG